MADGRTDTQPTPRTTGRPAPRLLSRILLTWFELTVVGLVGGALGTVVGGPPGFVLYLLTGLFTVAILFYNVDELIEARLQTDRE